MAFRMSTGFYNSSMFYGADAKTLRAAAILRKNMTVAELILWKKLKDKKIFRIKFRRQHPISIYIVDFYCHERNLVIEIDGEIHNAPENLDADKIRSGELLNLGLKIIRFSNYQVIYNLDKVIIEILNLLNQSNVPIYQGINPPSGHTR